MLNLLFLTLLRTITVSKSFGGELWIVQCCNVSEKLQITTNIWFEWRWSFNFEKSWVRWYEVSDGSCKTPKPSKLFETVPERRPFYFFLFRAGSALCVAWVRSESERCSTEMGLPCSATRSKNELRNDKLFFPHRILVGIWFMSFFPFWDLSIIEYLSITDHPSENRHLISSTIVIPFQWRCTFISPHSAVFKIEASLPFESNVGRNLKTLWNIPTLPDSSLTTKWLRNNDGSKKGWHQFLGQHRFELNWIDWKESNVALVSSTFGWSGLSRYQFELGLYRRENLKVINPRSSQIHTNTSRSRPSDMSDFSQSSLFACFIKFIFIVISCIQTFSTSSSPFIPPSHTSVRLLSSKCWLFTDLTLSLYFNFGVGGRFWMLQTPVLSRSTRAMVLF
jgi:hypothetical protein